MVAVPRYPLGYSNNYDGSGAELQWSLGYTILPGLV